MPKFGILDRAFLGRLVSGYLTKVFWNGKEICSESIHEAMYKDTSKNTTFPLIEGKMDGCLLPVA